MKIYIDVEYFNGMNVIAVSSLHTGFLKENKSYLVLFMILEKYESPLVPAKKKKKHLNNVVQTML